MGARMPLSTVAIVLGAGWVMATVAGSHWLFRSARGSHANGRSAPVELKVAMALPWGGAMPPAGALCSREWEGVDSRGQRVVVGACNCFESVNLFTSGDRNHFAYREWPAESLVGLDDPRTWDRLESDLKVNDVVEFIAHARLPDGTDHAMVYHVQLCVGPGGMMAGANNEARFDVKGGIPYPTHRWGACTSRQYYAAVRGMDEVWAACGRPMTYTVMVYKGPGWRQGISNED